MASFRDNMELKSFNIKIKFYMPSPIFYEFIFTQPISQIGHELGTFTIIIQKNPKHKSLKIVHVSKT